MGLKIMADTGRVSALKAGAAVAVLASGALVLFYFPPATSRFYPVCPFHQFTGLLCPGCGGTRALAALLHGRVVEAWADNALMVTALPLLIVYFCVGFCRQWLNGDRAWPQVSRMQVLALVMAAVLFAVFRNLE